MPSPNAMCGFDSRSKTSSSGRSNCSGSRFAMLKWMATLSPCLQRAPVEHGVLRDQPTHHAHRRLVAQELVEIGLHPQRIAEPSFDDLVRGEVVADVGDRAAGRVEATEEQHRHHAEPLLGGQWAAVDGAVDERGQHVVTVAPARLPVGHELGGEHGHVLVRLRCAFDGGSRHRGHRSADPLLVAPRRARPGPANRQ